LERKASQRLGQFPSATKTGSDPTFYWEELAYAYTQILSVAMSPVQNHIASGGDDGKLVVVDAVTGDPKFSCDAHEYWIRCVTYSLDGKAIATCSDDGTISVWNADDGNRLLGPSNCGVGAVLSVSFSPDGNVLLSGNAHS
jgi:WD40 repeat protein